MVRLVLVLTRFLGRSSWYRIRVARTRRGSTRLTSLACLSCMFVCIYIMDGVQMGLHDSLRFQRHEGRHRTEEGGRRVTVMNANRHAATDNADNVPYSMGINSVAAVGYLSRVI